jgi:PAS domain S-box-containing protein
MDPSDPAAREADPSFALWCATADTLPAMVFSAAPDGGIEFFNRRWTDFIGGDRASALATGWTAFVHPEDVGAAAEGARHSLATGEDNLTELRLRRADGVYCGFLCRTAPMRDVTGKIVRWYGIAVDIDPQKQAEEALRDRESELRDSELRFLALGEAIPVICWTADAGGWIDWYNRRWFEFTGQTAEEAEGWGWQAAHHPDDFLEVMRLWPHSIATGEPFEMEFRLRRADGVFHWFLTRVEPLRDATGTIVRWYGSNVDIDAQKQALERTKRVAEALQEVFLPKQLPQLPDVRFDAIYLPAEKDALVGGDWFDAFELPDGRIVFSIGDVAGHGLPASIIVGRLRQSIFTLACRVEDPAAILRETNTILRFQEPDIFVTALVGFVDPAHTRLTYATAGHPPPLIAYRNHEPAQMLPYGGPPLGIVTDPDFTVHSAPIESDTVVALYTDGMTEFSRDIFSAEAKLRMAVALLVGNVSIARPAVAVQEIVFDDLPARDDAALLLMQFSAVEALGPRSDAPPLEKKWRFHSSDANTARNSRREIVTYLCSLALENEDMFTSELIVGEILANTVEHAPGLVDVAIDWGGERPVVIVRDTGPGLRYLAATLPEDQLDEGGRGIYLIKTLADEASVRQIPGFGTEIRVVLPLHRNRTRDLAV